MTGEARESFEKKKDIAARLHEIGGIKFGEFTLTSGKKSPYYVDLRVMPSHPNLFDKVTDICTDLIREEISEDYSKVAGVPTAGLPIATLISQKLRLPLLYVRKEKKSHGRKKGVEGKFQGGELILIDDVTTTGGSIKKAAETVREESGKVKHAVVILDREEGAEEELEKIGVNLHSCYKITELINYLRESTKISEEEHTTIMNYLKNKK